MFQKKALISIISAVILGILAAGAAISAQDRYSLKVPGGLAFPSSRDTRPGRPSLSVTTEICSP